MLCFRQEKPSNSISCCPLHGILAAIFVQERSYNRGFLVMYLSGFLGPPRGEGISQFSQISEKSALNGNFLYIDDSCEIILKC